MTYFKTKCMHFKTIHAHVQVHAVGSPKKTTNQKIQNSVCYFHL